MGALNSKSDSHHKGSTEQTDTLSIGIFSFQIHNSVFLPSKHIWNMRKSNLSPNIGQTVLYVCIKTITFNGTLNPDLSEPFCSFISGKVSFIHVKYCIEEKHFIFFYFFLVTVGFIVNKFCIQKDLLIL